MIGFQPLADLDDAARYAAPGLLTMKGGRILLTGGTGFFGCWLLGVLTHVHARLKIECVVVSRDPAAFVRRAPHLATHPAVQLVEGDVRNFRFPDGTFSHVIHGAADTSAVAAQDPVELIDAIVRGTRRVLEFAHASGARRFLYLSSGAIYGAQPDDVAFVSESYSGAPDPLDPRSAYGQAKRLAEQLCVCVGGDVAPVIARPFAFVGPGMPLDGHFAIGNFIADAAAGRTICVRGDGSPLRGYLYAGDLAAWLITLLACGASGEAYNVGSDQAFTIADIAHRVADLASPRVAVNIAGRAASDGPRRRYAPSIAKARELGLDVWTPLDDAIRRTILSAKQARR